MNILYSIFLCILFTTSSYSKSYQNYVLYNVEPTTMDQLIFLQNLEREKYLEVMFWKRPNKLHHCIQILVSPQDDDLFLERVMHFGLRVELLISNIQKAFDSQIKKTFVRVVDDKRFWDHYHNLQDIYQWLADIAARSLNVDLEVIGKSTEGRDILALNIRQNANVERVIVEGGIHGHEWMSVAFVTYLINQLIHAGSSGDKKLLEVAKKYHWHIIPVINPDGYNYSFTEDRLWRKNRRMGEDFQGIDLDRNFDYKFGEFGASQTPTDRYYCGPLPNSETETINLVNFVTKHSHGLKFYFAFHAYGQNIVIPYAHTLKHVENYPEMFNYGRQAVGILDRDFGSIYGLGTYYDAVGMKMSGNSAGWVKSTFGTRYVLTFFLGDNGTYGFALPNDKINQNCKEGLSALVNIMTAKPQRFRSRYMLDEHTSKGCVDSANVMLVLAIMMIKVLV